MINVHVDSSQRHQSIRNGGGEGAICERRKQTDRFSQCPEGWTGPLAGVARGSAPLPEKILYFMGIK